MTVTVTPSPPDVEGLDLRGPFALSAVSYLDAGWWPIPCNGKRVCVNDVTGHSGRPVTAIDVAQWRESFALENVAVRLPPDVVCLDVDAYDDKPGRRTLDELVDQFGELPPSFVATARDLPSGRYLFRVPAGTMLRSTAGPGIDVVQFHHRYVVVAPSVHHTGAAVQWIDQQSGEPLDRIPRPEELPDLPWQWLEELSISGSAEAAPEADDDAVREWKARHTASACPGWLNVVVADARSRIEAGESRHDAVLRAACQTAREATAGAYTAAAAIDALRSLWADIMDDPRRTTEVYNIIRWAVGQLGTDASCGRVAEIGRRVLEYVAGRECSEDSALAGLREPVPLDDMSVDLSDEALDIALSELAIRDSSTGSVSFDGAEKLAEFRLDWEEFWTADHTESQFLIEPVLAAGRTHSLTAKSKTGKSLFVLNVVAPATLGAASLRRPAGDPLRVLYLDYEMTEADVQERLVEMGFDAEFQPEAFAYLLHHTLSPLDTRAGGEQVLALAMAHRADLVVIDTLSRAVEGEENDNDTVRALYLHTLGPLKRAGIATLRLDHTGHGDQTRARGGSAKGDDVDVGWTLEKTDGGFTLTARQSRVAWVPERVHLAVEHEPLVYRTATESWPAGTKEAATTLDRLSVPLDASERTARASLKDANESMSNGMLRAGLKWRRRTAATGLR